MISNISLEVLDQSGLTVISNEDDLKSNCKDKECYVVNCQGPPTHICTVCGASKCDGHTQKIVLDKGLYFIVNDKELVSLLSKIMNWVCGCGKGVFGMSWSQKGKKVPGTNDQCSSCSNVQEYEYSVKPVGPSTSSTRSEVFKKMKDAEKETFLMETDDVLRFLKNIEREVLKSFGLVPNFYDAIVKTWIPVISRKMRTGIDNMDENQHSSDKFNQFYKSFLKHKNANSDSVSKSWCELKTYVLTILKGKKGLIASTSQKRSQNTARAIITAGPHLPVGVVAVPRVIAQNQNIPILYNSFTMDKINQDIISDGANRPRYVTSLNNTKAITEDNSAEIINFLKDELQENRNVYVYYPLKNGNVLLLNRQPTLHRGSLQAWVIKIEEEDSTNKSTFSISPIGCPPFNADFDGDEMNAAFPPLSQQQYAFILGNASNHILSDNNSLKIKPGVQDAAVGFYKISQPGLRLTKRDALILIKETLPCAEKTRVPGRSFGKLKALWKTLKSLNDSDTVRAAELITCMFDDMLYVENKGKNKWKIVGGKFHEGTLALNSGDMNTIAISSFNCGGQVRCLDTINIMTQMSWVYLKFDPFTLSPKDFILDKQTKSEIREVSKVLEIDTERNSRLVRMGQYRKNSIEPEKVLQMMQFAEKTILEKMTEKIDPNNSLWVMINRAKSKGKESNLMSMLACVGIQMDGETNVMTHDYRRSASYSGWVSDNFSDGIKKKTPSLEVVARSAVVAGAFKTAETGYLQKSLVRMMIMMKVNSFGWVVEKGQILSFTYGPDSCSVRFKVSTEGVMKTSDLSKSEKFKKEIVKAKEYLKGVSDVEIPLDVKALVDYVKDQSKTEAPSAKDLEELASRTCGFTRSCDLPFLQPNQSVCAFVWTYLRPEYIGKMFDVDMFEQEFRTRLRSRLCQPGKAVGVIAAQSIGEPGTQGTLNTFHSAGKNIPGSSITARDIIIPPSSSDSYPCAVKVYPAEGVSLETLAMNISPVKLKDILKKNGFKIVMHRSKVAIRLDLEKERVGQYFGSSKDKGLQAMKNLFEKIFRKDTDNPVIKGDPIVDEFLKSGTVYIPFNDEINNNNDNLIKSLNFNAGKFIETVIWGVDGVSKAAIDPSGGCIVIEGVVLKTLVKMDIVDVSRTHSSSIKEMHEVFGVTAVAPVLIEQLSSRIGELDIQHIFTLASLQTSIGSIITPKRQKMALRDEFGIMQRILFEDPKKHMNSAVYGLKEDTSSPLVAQTFGQIPGFGTGFYTVR